jgi:hypothetical protein
MRADESWSDAERKRYERECLAQAREQLQRVLRGGHEPFKLLETRLEGDYPDTYVCVRLWDERFSRERASTYDLWTDPTFRGTRGIREPPVSVGMFITTWALGG